VSEKCVGDRREHEEVIAVELREKVGLAALCLVIVSWGLEIFDTWPLLVAHLTRGNWIALALMHAATLLLLIGVYAQAVKGTRTRREALLATIFAIISWSMDFSLIGKIGRY